MKLADEIPFTWEEAVAALERVSPREREGIFALPYPEACRVIEALVFFRGSILAPWRFLECSRPRDWLVVDVDQRDRDAAEEEYERATEAFLAGRGSRLGRGHYEPRTDNRWAGYLFERVVARCLDAYGVSYRRNSGSWEERARPDFAIGERSVAAKVATLGGASELPPVEDAAPGAAAVAFVWPAGQPLAADEVLFGIFDPILSVAMLCGVATRGIVETSRRVGEGEIAYARQRADVDLYLVREADLAPPADWLERLAFG